LKTRYWANQHSNQNGQNEKTNVKGKQPGEKLKKPHWDVHNLQPFPKNFYVPHSDVAKRSVCICRCRDNPFFKVICQSVKHIHIYFLLKHDYVFWPT